MAESNFDPEVMPYQFEPMTVSNKDSYTEESDTNIHKQASFMEHLGNTDWCSCSKCVPMPKAVECQCCKEMDSVQEQLEEQSEIECITSHKQFPIVCLNKDVLYI